jgi:hypothetical protein
MHPVRGVGQALDAVEVGPALGPAASYLEEVSSSATARSRRAEASSEGATNTRTPSACICGYCPPASSADTAALTPRLRSMPAISSASVRLATTATDTVAPSTIATPLLLVLPLGCSWLHGRTLADPWHSWKTSAGTSRRSLRGFALQGPVWPIRRASMGRWGWKPSGSKPRCRRQAAALATRTAGRLRLLAYSGTPILKVRSARNCPLCHPGQLLARTAHQLGRRCRPCSFVSMLRRPSSAPPSRELPWRACLTLTG